MNNSDSENIKSKKIAGLGFPIEKLVYSRYFIILLISIIYIGYIIIFQPLGLSEFVNINKPLYIIGYGIICAAILIINFFLLSVVLKLKKIHWLTKYSSFAVINIFEVAFFSWLYTQSFFKQDLVVNNFINHLTVVFLISVVPLFLIIFFEEKIILNKKIQIYKKYIPKEKDDQVITISSLNSNENIEIFSGQALCFKAAQNYTIVYYISGTELQKVIMRCTLKNIEEQLSNYKEFIRCHKSYIINKNNIKNIAGTSQNLKLILDKLNFNIPVSRKFSRKDITSLQ